MDRVKLNSHWKAILTSLLCFVDRDRLPVPTLALWSGADTSDVESVLYALRPFVSPNGWSVLTSSFDLEGLLEETGEWDRSTETVVPVFQR